MKEILNLQTFESENSKKILSRYYTIKVHNYRGR